MPIRHFLQSFLLLVVTSLPYGTDAQVLGCGNLQPSVVQTGPCHYRLILDNSSLDNCFQQVQLILNGSDFFEFVPAPGWRINQPLPNDLSVRPFIGFIPQGVSVVGDFSLDRSYSPDVVLTLLWDELCLMEGCAAEIPLDRCEGGIINGTVYLDCLGLPYNNQPVLEDHLIQLYDGQGAFYDQKRSMQDGSYQFSNLPFGQYSIQYNISTGWTPVVPSFGRYNEELLPGDELILDFGLCPECACDSVYTTVQPVSSNGDSCTYVVLTGISSEYCFDILDISIDTGRFANLEVLFGDFDVEFVDSQRIRLVSLLGGRTAREACARFSIVGGGDSSRIEVKAWTAVTGLACTSEFDLPCPEEIPIECIFGIPPGVTNLVENGYFSNGNAGFTSQYFYDPIPPLQNQGYWVGSSPPNIDSRYASCKDKTQQGVFGNMLICNGSTNSIFSPPKIVWNQTLPVKPNTNYIFNFWVTKLTPNSNPIILATINNSASALVLWNSLTPCQWIGLKIPWKSGANETSVVLSLINPTIQTSGNHFAIDNIEFFPCPLSPPPPDTCCASLDSFCMRVENAVSISVDNQLCKATFSIDSLWACDSIEFVRWDDGTQDNGPFGANSMVMHTYNQPGTYVISYSAIEYGSDGLICFQKTLTDTITLSCDSCTCLGFTNLAFHNFANHPDIPVTCDSTQAPVQLPCIVNDDQYYFTGNFGCSTNACPSKVEYAYMTPSGQVLVSGQGVPGGPVGYLIPGIAYQQFTNGPGLYQLMLTAICGVDTCKCIIPIEIPECGCRCGTFSNIQINSGSAFQSLTCGNTGQFIPCPPSGLPFVVQGLFQCQGPDCPPSAPVNWKLIPPVSPPIFGTSPLPASPGFSLQLPTSIFPENGLYQLEFTGICGGRPCPPCVVEFVIDCVPPPDPCRCDENSPFELLYSISRGPLLPVACGDTMQIPHDLPFNFVSALHCQPDSCDPGSCVDWILTGPPGFTPISQTCDPANPYFTIPLTPATFSYVGLYTLTMVGHCGQDSCECVVYFNSGGTCCTSMDAFCANIENTVVLTLDADSCKVTLDLSQLPPCDSIFQINWGNGPVFGPWGTGAMPMHTYSGSGTYVISYWAVEYDPLTGFICSEKEFRDTITLECAPCVCSREQLSLTHNGISYSLPCNRPGSRLIGCPADDVIISGFFGCIHPGTSDPCDETEVIWTLENSTGQIANGLSSNYSSLFFSASLVGSSNTYCLTLKTLCQGQMDSCICKVCWYQPACPDSCCTDEQAFIDRIDHAASISIDSSNCKVTMNIGDLPPCDSIEWVDWGDGNQIFGPFGANSMPMHTYSQSGSYIISWLAVEKDSNGFYCIEKFFRDTIVVQCDSSCVCSKEGLILNQNGVDFHLPCGTRGPVPILNCPPGDVHISGFFGLYDPITGEPCDETTVSWTLEGSVSGIIDSETTTNYSLFIFPASQVSAPQTYCLSLNTQSSDGVDCFCKTCWIQPPCDSCCTDLQAFIDRMEHATSINIDPTICKATLNIGNIPPCDFIEQVKWGDGWVDSGPYSGNSMVMHTYSQSGTYVISWQAVEKDSNGFYCLEKQFSDTITVRCDSLCPRNLVPNPSFESFVNCPTSPTGLSQLFEATSWTVPTGGSSDYYNTCASVASGVGIPGNFLGNESPRTGFGYAGFILRPINIYREYLEVPLVSPLSAKTYNVSFFVSLSDESQHAIDQLGAYFSNGSVGPISTAPVLPFIPQVVNPTGNYLTSKNGWTLISGTYTATGGETHLVIGNFSDNAATVPQTGLGGFYPGAYYYIDDVCVSEVETPKDTCCSDFDAFCALVAQGFAVVTDSVNCKVTVTAPQFDSCHWFTTPPFVVGTAPIQVITAPNGSWMFNFNQSGTYQICVNVFEADPNGNICWQKEMCTTIHLNCADSCQCGRLIWAEYYHTSSIPQQATCNNQIPINIGCKKFGPDFFIHGDVTCQPDSCGNDRVIWDLDRPGILSNVTGAMSSVYPHFDIGIPWSDFSQPGNYTLTVSRYCGSKLCSCPFNIVVEACPCTCDNLAMEVAMGFDVSGSFPSCKRTITPKGLCPGDQVFWTVDGAPAGNNTGNAGQMITFTPGTHLVCMSVSRTDPVTGQMCSDRYCKSLNIKCALNPNDPRPRFFCELNTLQNGDFDEGTIAGHLGGSGEVDSWELFQNPGVGRVFVIDSSGANDDGHLVFHSNKNNFAGIWQRTELAPEEFVNITFNVTDYNPDMLLLGARLEFRQQLEPIQGSPSMILYSVDLDNAWRQRNGNCNSWASINYSVNVAANPDLPYLVICLQNDSETEWSTIGIDNLEICSSRDPIVSTKEFGRNALRLYPNPSTGELNIEWTGADLNDAAVHIVSLTGQTLRKITVPKGASKLTTSVADLASGIYFVKILSEGKQMQALKFVKSGR